MKLLISWKRLNRFKKLVIVLSVFWVIYIANQLIWPPLIGGISCPGQIPMYSEEDFIQENNLNCQVIYIGSSCFGEEEVHQLVKMVKSILLHTRSVISFFIVTDTSGHKVLRHLFDTWQLQHVAMDISISNNKVDALTYFLNHSPRDISPLIVIQHLTTFNLDVSNIWQLSLSASSIENVIQTVFTSSQTSQKSQHQPKILLLHLSVIRNQHFCDSNNKDRDSPSVTYLKEIMCTSSPSIKLFNYEALPKQVLPEYQYSPSQKIRFLTTSGDILRTRTVPHNCRSLHVKPIDKFISSRAKEDLCYKYRYESCVKRRVHLYFHTTPISIDIINSNISNKENDVTMVTQLQFNRLEALYKLIDSWEGPMHVVLYLTDEEAEHFYTDVKARFGASNRRGNVYCHVVYKREEFNPINFLRNVGLNETSTGHVMVTDVDFVPSPGMYDKLLNIIKQSEELEKSHQAFLVPTFETFLKDYVVPEKKQDFLHDLRLGKVEPYHQSGFFKFKRGHRPHDYPHWMIARDQYKVDYAAKFEPYMVLKTADSPHYPEIQVERMQDKFAYTYEVHLKKIPMYVLHDVYMVHLPHKLSLSHQWEKLKYFERCTNYFYKNITTTLSMKYIDLQ